MNQGFGKLEGAGLWVFTVWAAAQKENAFSSIWASVNCILFLGE